MRPVDVPVLGGQRASDGVDIDLDLEELRRGTWIGERTLRLTNDWQVVFISSVPMTATGKGYAGVETLGPVSVTNEAENDRRDEALRHDLAGYGSSQIGGRFREVGNSLLSMINPLVVINVARKSVVTLGAKYHQFHVIFGEREGDGKDLAMRFELVEADGWGG